MNLQELTIILGVAREYSFPQQSRTSVDARRTREIQHKSDVSRCQCHPELCKKGVYLSDPLDATPRWNSGQCDQGVTSSEH